MKQSTKRQLDKLQQKELLKNIIPVICASLALLAIISAIAAYKYAPGETSEISGIVIAANGVTISQQGEKLYLVVKLDDGHEVMVRAPAGVVFRKNKKAKLIKTKTIFLGNVRYAFKEYVEDR